MTPAAVPTRVELDDPAPFLRWLGLDPSVDGRPSTEPGEPGRTVKLTRIQVTDATEPPADRISRLLISEERFEDTRRTLYYVLNELLRNVVQHSRDPLGGVIGAQVNWGDAALDPPSCRWPWRTRASASPPACSHGTPRWWILARHSPGPSGPMSRAPLMRGRRAAPRTQAWGSSSSRR